MADSNPIQIAIAPRKGTTTVPFLFTASGEGTGNVGAFLVDQSLGAIDIDGQLLTLVPFRGNDFFTTKQYGFAALNGTALYLVDFLCADNQLSELWVTSPAEGTLQKVGATGECSGVWGDTSIAVDLPASDFHVTPSNRITMHAEDDSLSLLPGVVGAIKIQGTEYELIPLAVRDCRSGCESGSIPVTLSVFIVDKTTNSVAPTTLSFYPDTPAANLGAAKFVPTLLPFPADAYNGSWSID